LLSDSKGREFQTIARELVVEAHSVFSSALHLTTKFNISLR